MTPETLAFENNKACLESIRRSRRKRVIFALNAKVRRLYREYESEEQPERKSAACAEVLNEIDRSPIWRLYMRLLCDKEDIRVWTGQRGKRRVIDNSDPRAKDYYSVAVIVKNEAVNMREWILFYLATGADRIYVYDNDSEDDLLGVLEPFLTDGRVVYRRWSGWKVHTAAYRDAVRRTKKRTKWLAAVDADEFLFSPKGSMPEMLKDYEDYPGVGVNWILFGPNGHDRRPEGLVMDNYTTALADHDTLINRHVKSIVQPARVEIIRHTHFARYKGGRFAVDETKEIIDNRYAFVYGSGRAFTAHNHRDIFRINHYITRSIEDLEEKCRRGYADGAPNTEVEKQLSNFNAPLEEDLSIKPYADIVREKY